MNTATNNPSIDAAGNDHKAEQDLQNYIKEEQIKDANFAHLLAECQKEARRSDACSFALHLAANGYQKIRIKGWDVSAIRVLREDQCRNEHDDDNFAAAPRGFKVSKKEVRVNFVTSDM
jgi:hypothetical protein